MVQRPPQLSGGRLRRHENEGGGRGDWIERPTEVDEMCAIAGQVWSAEEPGVPGVDLTRVRWRAPKKRVTESRVIHLRAGGSMADS